ncbi:MAG TPA: PKD domain-containing protein [Dokdonella sp.]|uniref:PKD domain-containing protein n=1 Tax=Dokdonella sp. TaxID=2291710 RepID=UPI002D800C25|nr:PKD domain-containing protein [Dokdonella sp.]HET9033862.1 PKD domain-containing protein [Dokdonella sp.]
MNPNILLPVRLVTLALALGAALSFSAADAAERIDCETTPFGASNLMLGDAEFMSLLSNDDRSFKPIGEYRLPRAGEPDALSEVYSGDLIPTGLPDGSRFLDAVNVDLNGDGRDEVAVAYGVRMDPGEPTVLGKIIIGIFERTPGFAPSARLIDSWQLDGNLDGTGMTTSSVELEAGDLRGTSTREQQLALKWRGSIGPTDGKMNVIVLTGTNDGRLAETDNTWAGRWRSTTGFGESSLAHGDVLLDGRDQLIVVAVETNSSGENHLHTHLLEYNAPGAHRNSGLVADPNDTAIGSLAFNSEITIFADDAFVSPNTPLVCPDASCTETVQISGQPHRVLADAGNLVDTAAAELLVHIGFFGTIDLRNETGMWVSGTIGNFTGQRLLHFSTVQAAPGADISAVTLSNSGPGRDFDSSQILGSRAGNGLPFSEATKTGFDSAIGRLYGAEQNQLALVRVVESSSSKQLQVDVYAAGVRLQSGFQFDVLGGTGPFPTKFTSTATGDVDSWHWDFGDGSSSVATNPSHNYNATGSYTVTLTVNDNAGKTSSYSTVIQINGQTSSGGQAESYTYQMDRSPQISAVTEDGYQSLPNGDTVITYNSFLEQSQPRIAIGDMNRDGSSEIMTNAQSVVREITTPLALPIPRVELQATIWRSLWRLDTSQIPVVLNPSHAQQVTASSISSLPLPYAASALLASDFDGDSVFATLGTRCGAVYEPQLRNLIWMPPFFSALQSDALGNGYMSASFGNQQSSGNSVENRSGSFTSHSVSAYVGVSAGTTDKEPVNFRATLKATAGHDWQTSKGAIHGEENEQTYSEGQAATQGEALVVSEGNSALCYSYDVVQSSGPVPNSGMRMCEISDHERTAQTAEIWNAQFIYGQTEPNWVPLQRDWASRALFVPPTSTIPFQNGRGLDKATDGLFSTAATSVSTTNPYLDIDLGSVQPIEAIRVFPAANVDESGAMVKPVAFNLAALDLQGFHVYVSANPFVGDEVPGGPGVVSFSPPTENGMVYDRWNIMVRDANYNPLPVRYIRLQHPDQVEALINISEIQVFGPTHSEPPAYPQAVCQPVAGTGMFLARVWNPFEAGYQNIEERGDMMWSGTNAANSPTGVRLANGDACINHPGIRQTTIWNNLRVGNSGITHSWDSTSNTSQTVGSYGGIESTTRVGAELELELGNTYVYAVAGLSYEYSFGVTREKQSVSYWGNGLQIGGSVGGFDNEYQNLVLSCGYFPHPYAYQLSDRGSINYQHDLYVVDYTVAQPNNSNAWQRGSVPLECYGIDTSNDTIFADGFDG